MNSVKNNTNFKKPSFLAQNSLENFEQKQSKTPTSPSFVRSAVSQMFPLGSQIAEQKMATPNKPVETAGGAKIPTFAENAMLAQKRAQEAFFAKQKAEFDAIVQKNKQKEREQIEQALQVIKQEVARIEKLHIQSTEKIRALQKIALSQKGEKSGVYDINFLDIFIQMLRTISADVSNNNTWMEALVTRKAKRGSAFAARSKKKGTSYSQSEELKVTRSVQ